jgi:hypothetical protein
MGPIEKRMEQIEVGEQFCDPRNRVAIKKAMVELARQKRLYPIWPESIVDQLPAIARCNKDLIELVETHGLDFGTPPQSVLLEHYLSKTAALALRALATMEASDDQDR